MTVQPTQGGAHAVAAGRLWAGGVATAVVAALVAVVGILLARGVFDVPVLAPEGEGVWGDADTGKYALYAALAALVATGLLHVLLIATPRPLQFFGWIITLATVAAALAPLAINGSTSSKLATALINLVVGIAIGTLLSAAARSAMRPSLTGP
jgi:cytochrome b561